MPWLSNLRALWGSERSPRCLSPSRYMAGFECSSQLWNDGRRLDITAATGHDRHALADYQRARAHGMTWARDGFRWHLIEPDPGHYDWSSVRGMLAAAKAAGIIVIWDLCHYGVPAHVDVFSATFIDSFARFAAAAADEVRRAGLPQLYCPINEISYWAWAGGEVAHFHPTQEKRGSEFKRQLVRAFLAAVDAVKNVAPEARFLCAEPLVCVQPGFAQPEHLESAQAHARAWHDGQFEALAMLVGQQAPELGGHRDAVHWAGLNYYPSNQWWHGGCTIPLGHHAYRPLRDLLGEAHRRFGLPMMLSETGAEGSARPSWLHYVAAEVRAAQAAGLPIEGICLYPILDYPGWGDDRVCEAGLFGLGAERSVYEPLARQILTEH